MTVIGVFSAFRTGAVTARMWFSMLLNLVSRRCIVLSVACVACGGTAVDGGSNGATGGVMGSGATSGTGGAPEVGGQATGGQATGGAIECTLWEPSPELPPIVYCDDSCGYQKCGTPEEIHSGFGLGGAPPGAECPAAEVVYDPPEDFCARTALCAVEAPEPGLCCYAIRDCIK